MTAGIPFAKTDRSGMCGIVCLHSASWEISGWELRRRRWVEILQYVCMYMIVHVCTVNVYIHPGWNFNYKTSGLGSSVQLIFQRFLQSLQDHVPLHFVATLDHICFQIQPWAGS